MGTNPDASTSMTGGAIAALTCDDTRRIWNTGDPPEGARWSLDGSAVNAVLNDVAKLLGLAAADADPEGESWQLALADGLGQTDVFKAMVMARAGADAGAIVAVARRSSANLKGDCYRNVAATLVDAAAPGGLLAGVAVIGGSLVVAALGVALVIIGVRTLTQPTTPT